MLTALLLAAPLLAHVDPDVASATVREAIVQAVARRMGQHVEVEIEDLHVTSAIDGAIEAVPDPGAQLGRSIGFTLRALEGGADGSARLRAGRAEARVRVVVDHAHLSRAVSRGARLESGDVVGAHHAITSGPLQPWPTVQMMSRGVMLRALAADSCLTRAMVQSTPLVRTGDAVTVVARSAGVEVSARMVAASSGDLGAVIRVVNQQSRRAVSARVVAAGVVETIHD